MQTSRRSSTPRRARDGRSSSASSPSGSRWRLGPHPLRRARRASVKANVGFHATAELTAGGLWKKGEGLQGILEGPSVEFTPRWDASVGGDVYAKCALLPQITLYVYDAAGPSLTAGPYVDGGLRRPPSGPTSWNASAGFSADIGGRVSLFGYDLVDEHKNLIDRKFGSWNGTLPF